MKHILCGLAGLAAVVSISCTKKETASVPVGGVGAYTDFGSHPLYPDYKNIGTVLFGGRCDAPGALMVHGLKHPKGDHAYSAKAEDIATLTRFGYEDEGITFCTPAAGTPVYELYLPKGDYRLHAYTRSHREMEDLMESGYKKNRIPAFFSAASGGVIYGYKNHTNQDIILSSLEPKFFKTPGKDFRLDNTDGTRGVKYTSYRKVGNGTSFSLAGVTTNLWESGQTLRVRFVNGSPEQQDHFMKVISNWKCGLRYQKVTSGFAEVRVRLFGTGNTDPGSHSMVGRDSLKYSFDSHGSIVEGTDGPSLSVGWNKDGTILHEFGHALGLDHEHVSPRANIQWNKEAVYSDLSGPPNNWSREKIDGNVFQPLGETKDSSSGFDPNSIMIYEIPKHWTKNGFSAAPPESLSFLDAHFIWRLYGQVRGGECGGFAWRPCMQGLQCVVPNGEFDGIGVCK